ncbi:MAG: glycosyltransferase [Vicinamibacterales bacterium]
MASDPSGVLRPFVSVIIPVFNDARRLRGCLDALEQQTYPADRYEVVVVDNGSTDRPESVVAAHAHAVCVREPRPGSYAARNAGLARAKGEVLAFTDADARPEPGWLEHGVRRLGALEGDGMVGGRLECVFDRQGTPNFAERFDAVTYLRQQHYVERQHFAATANMFATRAVFDRVGGFRADLFSSGDAEWGTRVHRAGFPQAYADDAVVAHRARGSVWKIIALHRRLLGGWFALRSTPALPHHPTSLWQLLNGFPLYPSIWFSMRQHPQVHGRGQALSYYAFSLCLRYVQALEWIRLSLGGRPRR